MPEVLDTYARHLQMDQLIHFCPKYFVNDFNDDSHLAEVVVVAEVEVPRGVGGPLVLRDHLQHRQRVEYPRQEDDPHV